MTIKPYCNGCDCAQCTAIKDLINRGITTERKINILRYITYLLHAEYVSCTQSRVSTDIIIRLVGG